MVPSVRDAMHTLNEVFASPLIVKVFHGAEKDIIWLQRDFGLYVVNMFDTYHASRKLSRQGGHSLASLLSEFTTFIPDKRYQLADWRIRPLPVEMLNYARSDTHFLLHIYECLRAHPAMSTVLLHEIRKCSADTAKQVYEHVGYDAEQGEGSSSWRRLAEKTGKAQLWGLNIAAPTKPSSVNLVSKINFEVFKAVHQWRDRIARIEDESQQYLLPNSALIAISDLPPKSLTELGKIIGHTLKGNSLRSRKDELLSTIIGAISKVDVDFKETRLTGDETNSGLKSSSEITIPTNNSSANVPSSSILYPFSAPRTAAVAWPLSSSASALFPEALNQRLIRSAFGHDVTAKVHRELKEQMNTILSQASASTIDAFSIGHEDSEQREPGPFIKETGEGKEESARDEIIDVYAGRRKPANGKKRKRNPNGELLSSNAELVIKESTQQHVLPFDYDTVKSVLDTEEKVAPGFNSIRKSRNEAQQRKVQGGDASNAGIFKNAPRSLNQPKSGNRSQTFV